MPAFREACVPFGPAIPGFDWAASCPVAAGPVSSRAWRLRIVTLRRGAAGQVAFRARGGCNARAKGMKCPRISSGERRTGTGAAGPAAAGAGEADDLRGDGCGAADAAGAVDPGAVGAF